MNAQREYRNRDAEIAVGGTGEQGQVMTTLPGYVPGAFGSGTRGWY